MASMIAYGVYATLIEFYDWALSLAGWPNPPEFCP
jgi:hypothetical protein